MRPISITPNGLDLTFCLLRAWNCVVVNVPDAVRRCQPLCPDRCEERLYADDIHDAREIIGEYVQ
jgi:hypothetical protein